MAKRRNKNKFDVSESFSFDDSNAEEAKKNIKFRNEGDLSDISYSKDNESEEELVTEEMFQKVLTETKLELNANRKAKYKVKSKI